MSFQLSFGAVVGLLVLARPLTRAVSFLPGPLPEQVGVTTAASISTAPVSMLTFGSASLVSVPANVAGGFVLGPIMFLGMLSLLLGFVSEWLSAPLNVVAGLFIGFLLAVSHFFAGLPGAVYEYQGVTLRLVLVVGLLAEVAVVAALAARAGGGLLAYVRDRRRWPPLAAATAALVAAALLLAPAPVRPPDRPTLTFLDVGEGAATLLQVPGGPTVLVDAGPEPLAARAAASTRVERIDLLVLSHGHADHVGRPRGRDRARADRGRRCCRSRRSRRPRSTTLAAALRAAGTDVRRCTTHLRLRRSRLGAARAAQRRRRAARPATRGENDDALVAVVELAGQRVLVPGDAEGRGARATSTCRPATWSSCRITAAAAASTRAFLGELAPRLARRLRRPEHGYGHPTAEMPGAARRPPACPARAPTERGDIALSAGRARPAA